MSPNVGWYHMKAVHSLEVPGRFKPDCNCQVCGMPLYVRTINLKRGPVRIAYEDGFHGDGDVKVIYNHNHATESRQSCCYCKPGHDVVTGKKIMTDAEESALKTELEAALEGSARADLADIIRKMLLSRALEIQDQLIQAGKPWAGPLAEARP